MRSTNDIIIAVKESEPVTKEELKMACLVLSNLLYFHHQTIRRLVKGGAAAELEKKLNLPDAYGDLGMPEYYHQAMLADPIKYLGPGHIPGTPEYEAGYGMSKKVFDKVMKEMKKDGKAD